MLTLLCTLLLADPALAQSPPPRGGNGSGMGTSMSGGMGGGGTGDGGGMHHGGQQQDDAGDDGDGLARMAERLELSADQQAKLEDAVHASQLARVDLRARKERAQLELKHLLGQTSLDAKAIGKAVDALNASEGELRRNRVDLVLAVRGILTEAQWKECQQMRRQTRSERREERREGREERREGREGRGER
jgi:Spy/CpxP family protein refolding chaperone